MVDKSKQRSTERSTERHKERQAAGRGGREKEIALL